MSQYKTSAMRFVGRSEGMGLLLDINIVFRNVGSIFVSKNPSNEIDTISTTPIKFYKYNSDIYLSGISESYNVRFWFLYYSYTPVNVGSLPSGAEEITLW